MAGLLRSAIGRGAALLSSGSWPRCLRPFSAAAAAELDYWSEWEAEEEEQRRRRGCAAVAPAKEEAGGRGPCGVHWVFMGGAQKRVHAARLADLLSVPYISMSSLLRRELSPQSDLHRKIAAAVNERKLVPEDIIFGLLSKRLEEGYRRGETGFILDGIPRTRLQAEILDELVDIDLVVNFLCPDNHLTKIHGGNICAHCGKPFNSNNSTATDHDSCTVTNSKHAVDLEALQFAKLRAYSEQSKELEDYYRRQNKLVGIQISAGPTETWRGLLSALRLQHIDSTPLPYKFPHLDAISSQHKLTV